MMPDKREKNHISLLLNKLGQKTPMSATHVFCNYKDKYIYIKLNNGLMLRATPLSLQSASEIMEAISREQAKKNKLFHRQKFIEILCDDYSWISNFPSSVE